MKFIRTHQHHNLLLVTHKMIFRFPRVDKSFLAFSICGSDQAHGNCHKEQCLVSTEDEPDRCKLHATTFIDYLCLRTLLIPVNTFKNKRMSEITMNGCLIKGSKTKKKTYMIMSESSSALYHKQSRSLDIDSHV